MPWDSGCVASLVRIKAFRIVPAALLPAIAVANSGIIQVTGVRSWSHIDSTRVIIEMTGPFEYKSDRALDPDRLFFDISHARPWIGQKRFATHEIGDTIIKRVRI